MSATPGRYVTSAHDGRVFVSHASEDQTAAARLAEALEMSGTKCWIAHRDVPVGTNYAEQIVAAMMNADAVVFLLSQAALVSPHVRREVNLAVEQGKVILPLTRDPSIALGHGLPSDWSYWLGLVQIHVLETFEDAIPIVRERLITAAPPASAQRLEYSDADRTCRERSGAGEVPSWVGCYLAALAKEFASLESVFTMLKLQGGSAWAGAGSTDLPLHGLEQLVRSRRGDGEGDSVELAELEAPRGRWLVLGPPGSGKTTLAHVLCLASARAAGRDSRPLPMLVDLGRYRPGCLADLTLVAESVRRLARERVSADDISTFLSHPDRQVVWYLDSLDEALIGRRDDADSAWLEVLGLVDRYPSHSFVVNCRSSHAPSNQDFDELAIRDFSDADCERFVARYLEFFDADVAADRIIAAIPDAARSVARTPLLLSMMVSLYISHRRIPESLEEIYRIFVRQVFERIEAARPSHVDPYVKDVSCAALAFEMLLSGHAYMGRRAALEVLSSRLGQLAQRGEVTTRIAADRVLDELVYSGVIVQRGTDIGFLHLTLLEYFAACEMKREYSFSAHAEMDQYFLRNPKKIEALITASGARVGDHILELGAGIGSVARHVPHGVELALLDLDAELVRILRYQYPNARVLQADAVATLPTEDFDVLLSNLPYFLTDPILQVLARKRFRAAVLSVRDDEPPEIPEGLAAETVEILDEDDFFPRQPFKSRLLLVRPDPERGHPPTAV